MFQPVKQNGRYPNFLVMGWWRDDGDFDTLAALNGDQIDDDNAWNFLVETTHGILNADRGGDVVVLEREELTSVLTIDQDEETHVEIEDDFE